MGAEPAAGLFVVIEGVEGAGKSTQVEALARLVRESGHHVVMVREPGGTPAGEEIRAMLRAPARREHPLTPTAEALLFNAARSLLVAGVIRPALTSGAVVLADRFTGSTLAYQGYGRGMSLAELTILNAVATGGLTPDLTILLDLPVERGLARKRDDDDDHYIGAEGQAFHERVRSGFLSLAAEGGWLVIDSREPPAAVTGRVWGALEPLLS